MFMRKIIWNVRQVLVWPVIQILKVGFLLLRRTDIDKIQIRRILIYTPMGIGNMVFFIPTLEAIRQRFPTARISLLVERSPCKDLLHGTALVDEFLLLPEKAGIIEKLRLIRKLRKQQFQLLVSNFLGEGVFLTLLSILGNIPIRVGHATSPGWKNAKDFINNIKVTWEEHEHEIDRNLRLARALGARIYKREPVIPIDEKSGEFAKRFLENLGISDNELLIGIQIGASAHWKQWNLDNFAKLCDRLIEEYKAKVILLGAPSERDMAKYVSDKMYYAPINAVGKTKIKEAAALIKRCDLFICNDSGLGKISLAMDTPTITIGGPTDLYRTGAWKEGHIDIRKNLPCSPCYTIGVKGLIKVQSCKDRRCLKSITVDDVIDGVNKLLNISRNR